MPNYVFVQSHSEARPVGDSDPTTTHYRCAGVFLRQRGLPGNIQGVILQRQKILRGGSTVHVCHATDRSSGKVHSHRHSAFFGHIPNFVSLENSACGRQIGMNFADCVLFTKHSEWFFQVNVLSGEDGSRALIRNRNLRRLAGLRTKSVILFFSL